MARKESRTVIVVVALVMGGSFIAGLLLGQHVEREHWRRLGASGWRVWYLGLVYPLSPDGRGPTDEALLDAARRRRHGKALIEKLGPRAPRR